ncbi:filamentation protein-like protein [Lindgomyces ingoldianus]|uniref:Filamentation protein-like protein n=1 Tax=Lindgomyces ingoldianus TaxID=673940 RepID=A0ACB6QA10_9PLEO|nr:filamentation protein-like protein [Lindgomyces ingoldianus]KAF2463742.1 filamentation protein-like protein [Lindgomyces ingoldianus]
MGGPPENEKALRYISQLDEARCTGRWKDVPELCRKIEKHAPHRRCLTLTARSEVQIATYSTQRPSTSASTASTGLSKIIPSLLTAIDEEGDYVEDAFQATVCLGWLHYVLEEPGLAVARLPKDFAVVAVKMSGKDSMLSPWSRACIVKGVFLKGSSQERIASVEDAVGTYRSIIEWLSSLNSLGTESPQFKAWTERSLVRLCQLSDQSAETGEYVDPAEALQVYRFWAKYWESTAKTTGADGPNAAKYRRLAWKAYYDTLSAILRHSLPYNPESTALENQSLSASEKSPLRKCPSLRLQQRAELKRVETVYESLLLKETHFPKASESNNEIEAWTDAVMDNWRVLCGPTWRDEDLGEGGKEAVGRGVLDILYRAATKTFHSTQILRHLFTVHASLAEFELAFKAYDSYVEIITRGKDRAEKTGEEDVGIDDDSTVLRTSAEAIRVLCRFGSRKEAEKALDIGNHIEKWLEQTYHIKSTTSETGSAQSAEAAVAPRALGIAYCAIGVCQAHWARFTYVADARTGIQTKAVQYLRRSLDPKCEDPNNIEALYALGLVLAEMRDIPGAIKIVKRALSPATKHKSSISVDGVMSRGLTTEYGRERKLIPLWHLLALLLTARSEYSNAERSCEAAFEQFGDPLILFGSEDENQAYRSEHLNELNGKTVAQKPLGLVDQMECFEKTGILQVKMTQLALVEVVEGSSAAVDGCDELLALYARLFGDPNAEQAKLPPPSTAMPPPKSAVGTIRGSIFRSRSSAKATPKDTIARNSSVTTSSRPSTVATQATAAPAIQVTDEDGVDRPNGHSHHHHIFQHKHDEERQGPTRSPSKLQKRSANSLRRRSEMDATQTPDVPDLPDGLPNGTSARNSSVREKPPRRPSMSNSLRRSIESHDRPLRSVPHNMPPSSQPPLPGHSHQPPKQDVRLSTPLPGSSYIPSDPRFSKIQERRHRVSLLAGIWTFISGLYTRAEMYEDAKGAVDEALKLAETFEAEVAQDSSTSKSFADRGWGGGKSIEELWADAFAARAELLVAQSMKHEARSDFERAVLHFPDHPEAIVGLSNILLDIYCKIIPLEPSEVPDAAPGFSPSVPSSSHNSSSSKTQHLTSHTPSAENQISPPELNRLAARDRAFGLLSTLTKLGVGWDYSEAWYALARAYEESGQIEKTKEVLWWCVELEDAHPVRSWKSVALGGFVL